MFACDQCPTHHNSSQALWKHKLLHNGEQIKCSNFSVCGYSSVYIADVKVHETRCGKSREEKDWECDCGSQFTVKQNWQKHLRRNPEHKLIRKKTSKNNDFCDWLFRLGQPPTQAITKRGKRKSKHQENLEIELSSGSDVAPPMPNLNARTRIPKRAKRNESEPLHVCVQEDLGPVIIVQCDQVWVLVIHII